MHSRFQRRWLNCAFWIVLRSQKLATLPRRIEKSCCVFQIPNLKSTTKYQKSAFRALCGYSFRADSITRLSNSRGARYSSSLRRSNSYYEVATFINVPYRMLPETHNFQSECLLKLLSFYTSSQFGNSLIHLSTFGFLEKNRFMSSIQGRLPDFIEFIEVSISKYPTFSAFVPLVLALRPLTSSLWLNIQPIYCVHICVLVHWFWHFPRQE